MPVQATMLAWIKQQLNPGGFKMEGVEEALRIRACHLWIPGMGSFLLGLREPWCYKTSVVYLTSLRSDTPIGGSLRSKYWWLRNVFDKLKVTDSHSPTEQAAPRTGSLFPRPQSLGGITANLIFNGEFLTVHPCLGFYTPLGFNEQRDAAWRSQVQDSLNRPKETPEDFFYHQTFVLLGSLSQQDADTRFFLPDNLSSLSSQIQGQRERINICKKIF